MGGLAALIVALAGLFQGPGEWSQVWRSFLRARAVDGDAAAAAGVVRERAAELADPLRHDLLGALAGDVSSRASLARTLSTAGDWPLADEESWLAAEVLVDGPTRGRAVLAALRSGGPDRDRLRLAHEAGVQAAEDLRLVEAIGIQRLLHGQNKADWSAINLALTLRRSGDYEGAEGVLGEQSERNDASGEIWSQRGLNALAAGEERRARDLLGKALVRDSQDAGVILARLDLARGRRAEARRAFAALLVDEPGAWAYRGWGVSLVEEPLPRRESSGPGSHGRGSSSVP